MLYDELTNSKKKKICFTLTARTPCEIQVLAYDKQKTNTYYMNRIVEMRNAGEKAQIEVLLPLSPDILTIDIKKPGAHFNGYEFTGTETFEISDYKVKDLYPKGKFMTPDQQRFMQFAKEFSKDAGWLEPGKYTSDSEEYTLLYLDNLVNSDGSSSTTPARVNKETGEIEINHFVFRQYSIPVRMFILCHEYSHFYMNRDPADEEQADKNALAFYTAMGFPHVEAVYALTNILNDSPENQHRIEQLLKNMEKQGTLKQRN